MVDFKCLTGPAQMSSSFGSFEIPEGVIPKSSDGGGVGTTVSNLLCGWYQCPRIEFIIWNLFCFF